jgi:hypothetical protein
MAEHHSVSKGKLPGHEYPSVNEHIYIRKMIDDLKRHSDELYPKGKKMLRHAHPKMHGYVKAEFTVSGAIDDSLKVGLFKEARTHDAYIRFSNGQSQIRPDVKKDVRGMAIRLMDVPGKKLLDEVSAADIQDFVLIDNEVFMSKDTKEFHKVIHAVSSGKSSLIRFLLNPLHLSTLLRLIKFQKQCRHVLDTPYWSATPYLFGDGRAVKYHIRPANEGILPGGIDKTDKDYLRTNMIDTLSKQDVFFDFFIQLQTDADEMPVEDPTVKWTSPFIKVGNIKIPKQVFDTEDRVKMGTDLSFSPWHSLEEHRPLGGFNRARKAIYKAMSEYRRERN